MLKSIIEGKYVNIRNIQEDDADFVLTLRCDEKKSQYLNKTEYNIEKQKIFIKNSLKKDNEWYLIIENKQRESIGTYRIYDLKKNSFCIGSWLMKDGCSPFEMMEGEYLAKMYAFEQTGLQQFHFSVHKANKKVVRYHKLMGAKIIGENDIEYDFECSKEDYLKNIEKYLNI